MAVEQALTNVSLRASGDLSAYQFRFVKLNASGQVVLAGDGEWAIGVLQNKPTAAGQGATVAISGISKAVAGGTLTPGNAVASDAQGRAIRAGTGDYILGVALESATAAGQVVSVLLAPRPSTL